MPLTPAERITESVRLYGAEAAADVRAQLPGLMDLEILNAVEFPHPSLTGAYESGCAEPWTTQVVASLLIASNQRTVLETGGFTGQTSAWMAMALERLGGGHLTAVDIDPTRVAAIGERLKGLDLQVATYETVESDILKYLPTVPNQSIGFAWIDDNHEKWHVEREINLLWPKMKKGGIMTFHDVKGSCDLQTVVKKYGGYSIDLPRLGAAGGLGILQIPT